MQAFEFEIEAKKNIIEIPSEYSQLYSKHIKVIILIAEPANKKYDLKRPTDKLSAVLLAPEIGGEDLDFSHDQDTSRDIRL